MRFMRFWTRTRRSKRRCSSSLPGLVPPATVLAAAGLTALPSAGPLVTPSLTIDAVILMAAVLIVVPSYVNQVGISLASPLTVRVVLATGPVLIFLVQLIEGRLSASPYSLAAAILYAVFAISAGLARQHAIRSTFSA